MKETVRRRLALTDRQRAPANILTREQRVALKEVFDRPIDNRPPGQTYRGFRRTVQLCSYDSAVMVPWCRMWLGIETDGYTHS